MSVIVSGDFCRFKLALPSLLFMSKDEVKAAHSDFDRSTRRWFAPRKSSLSAFFSALFYDLRSFHPGTYERFLLAFPSSLLSGYALNKQTGHGRERDLNTRSIFSLPRVVRSINIQYLPHPHRDTSPFRWRNISPCHKFQKKCTRRKQQYSFRIPTSNLRKAMIPKYLP